MGSLSKPCRHSSGSHKSPVRVANVDVITANANTPFKGLEQQIRMCKQQQLQQKTIQIFF